MAALDWNALIQNYYYDSEIIQFLCDNWNSKFDDK